MSVTSTTEVSQVSHHNLSFESRASTARCGDLIAGTARSAARYALPRRRSYGIALLAKILSFAARRHSGQDGAQGGGTLPAAEDELTPRRSSSSSSRTRPFASLRRRAESFTKGSSEQLVRCASLPRRTASSLPKLATRRTNSFTKSDSGGGGGGAGAALGSEARAGATPSPGPPTEEGLRRHNEQLQGAREPAALPSPHPPNWRMRHLMGSSATDVSDAPSHGDTTARAAGVDDATQPETAAAPAPAAAPASSRPQPSRASEERRLQREKEREGEKEALAAARRRIALLEKELNRRNHLPHIPAAVADAAATDAAATDDATPGSASPPLPSSLQSASHPGSNERQMIFPGQPPDFDVDASPPATATAQA